MNESLPGRIFISYRRQETAWPARQLYDVLVEHFPADQIFKDVDTIQPGDDFTERITAAVASCDVLLALIGPQWLTDESGRRRLDNPGDYVRLEIETALTREIQVIPILVDGAQMPRVNELPPSLASLTRRLAIQISPLTFDTDRLISTVRKSLAGLKVSNSATGSTYGGSSNRSVVFEVVEGDITSFVADLVAFKYAGGFHGADRQASRILAGAGLDLGMIQPEVGEHRLIDPGRAMPAHQVLFIGVPALLTFKYAEIRQFGSSVIRIMVDEVPDCRHLAMTLHGANVGLDEVEALLSMVTGCMEAVADRPPRNLERVSVVERDASRAGRLRRALQEASHDSGELLIQEAEGGWLVELEGATGLAGASAQELSQLPGADSERKAHIFVAMPFAGDFSDLFEYGIQRPVRDLGFLCERVDQDVFTGDVLDRIKSRIESSTAVVAVLTGASPNVYLEVGYAWGKGRPTIFVTKEQPKFDLQGQRYLDYERIQEVEEKLTRELRVLLMDGRT